MPHSLRYLFPFLLLMMQPACSRTPSLPPLAQDGVVLAFGDSLTYGTGATPDQSYPAVLTSLINRQVVNAGIPGEISADGAARLPALLDRFHPSLLILCHGANDILNQMDRGQAAVNLRTMVKAARDRGVSVVLIGVPEFGLTLSTPPYYGEIAHEYALPFEDGTLAKIERHNELKSDIIHPNATGYRMMAEAIAVVLRTSGAI